jgi:hypothetical protein
MGFGVYLMVCRMGMGVWVSGEGLGDFEGGGCIYASLPCGSVTFLARTRSINQGA